MARPKKCRRICGLPDYWSFVPENEHDCGTIELSLDEFESIRLIDYQKLTQEECARAMNVARTTVTAIYESARHKMADALVNGKRLLLKGGTYQLQEQLNDLKTAEKGGNIIMRIALTYENGMVGQHFGHTKQFKLYDVDGSNTVTATELLSPNGAGHGALATVLKQAQTDVLICGGIGQGARMAVSEVGIKLIAGVCGNADEVIKDYLEDKLQYSSEQSCQHHDREDGHHCHHEHESHECGHHGCHK